MWKRLISNFVRLFKHKNSEKFEPFVFYNPPGDEIEVFFSRDDYYGEWINPHLTVYYKEGNDKEIIGCCIHSVNRLMKKDDQHIEELQKGNHE